MSRGGDVDVSGAGIERSGATLDASAPPVVNCYPYHSTIFPHLPDEFAEFKRVVRGLSRTDALFWCARINLVVSGSFEPRQEDRHRDLVRSFFRDEDVARIDQFVREHGGRDVTSVFFRGQMLELMRWVSLLAIDGPSDGRTFESLATRSDFARAALMATSIWERRVYGDRFEGTSPVLEARFHAASAVRRAHIETASAPYPMVAIARGVLLFRDSLRRLEPDFEPAFAETTGLTLDEWFSALAYAAVRCFGRSLQGTTEPEGYGLIDGHRVADAAVDRAVCAFFARESQSVDELKRAFWSDRADANDESVATRGFAPITAKPFLRDAEGRLILLDACSFTGRAAAGPVFDLIRSGRADARKWMPAFGLAFEDYCNGILRRIYPEQSDLLAKRFIPNPAAMASRNRVELADAVLLGPTSAALVEAKAVWLRDDSADPRLDGAAYRKVVRDKYAKRKNASDGERRVLGVAQLARSITALADGTWVPCDLELSAPKRIVPVLIAYDSTLNAVGHSQLFADEFAYLLAPEREANDWRDMRCGEIVVAHLVVMTVDELELLETSSETFSIMDCLEDYSRACTDRMLSFHNYLVRSPYRQRLRSNQALLDRAMRLLEDVSGRLFPEAHVE